MIWSAATLKKFAIQANDGAIGAVNDFLFDDRTWKVRWLVVDTGSWLPGRKVLLPPGALRAPDGAARVLPVAMSKQQIKDSPEIDTDKPVSRQLETNLFGHYELDPYWDRTLLPLGGGVALPLVPPPLIGGTVLERDPELAADVAGDAEGDANLRSASDIVGHALRAVDGDAGHVADFLIDDHGWSIATLIGDSGTWLGGERTPIMPGNVRSISDADKVVALDVTQDKIKGAPGYSAADTMSDAEREKYQAWYRVPWEDK